MNYWRPGIQLLLIATLSLSCDQPATEPAAAPAQEVGFADPSPPPTGPAGAELDAADPGLVKKAGRYSFEGSPFTGSITEHYPDGTLKSRVSYRNGLKDGIYRTWWTGGTASVALHYRGGRKNGLQEAWWENGNRRYTFTTFPGGPEGKKEEWFENGQPYRLMNYRGGMEHGLQQGWYRDGRRHFNYVYRNGRRYGLPGKRLCESGEK